MRKFTLSFILLVGISFATNAQRYLGIATSNWSGTNALYLNPANIADSRTQFSIDLASFNFGVDNNLGPLSLSGAFSSFGGSTNLNQIFSTGNQSQFSMLLPYAEFRLPGFMVSINHKTSFAITLRARFMNQFNNFNQTLFTTIADSTNFSANTNHDFVSNNLNWTAQGWGEANFTLGQVLYEQGEHMLKGGITVRYLAGFGFVSAKGSLNVHYGNADTSLTADHTTIQLASSPAIDFNNVGSSISNVFNNLKNGGSGRGIGGDIGLVYEYRPEIDEYVDPKTKQLDNSSNKYKVRLSFAITDIGAIKYDNVETQTFVGNGKMSASDISNNFANFKTFKDYATARGFTYDSSMVSMKVQLPTSLVAGIDYYIASHFYVNATFISNLTDRQNVGNSVYNQLTLTPRFDTKFYTLGVPITYSYLTGGIKAGFGMRIGGFFMGTDDMLAFFSNTQYGVNFYAGLYVPINKKNKITYNDLQKMEMPSPSSPSMK